MEYEMRHRGTLKSKDYATNVVIQTLLTAHRIINQKINEIENEHEYLDFPERREFVIEKDAILNHEEIRGTKEDVLTYLKNCIDSIKSRIQNETVFVEIEFDMSE